MRAFPTAEDQFSMSRLLTKRSLLLLSATLLVAVALPAFAQDSKSAAAGGYKIGCADVEQIIENYEKRKARMGALESKVKAMQVEIDKMTTALDASKADYDKNKDSWTDEQRRTKRNEIEESVRKIRQETENRQRTIDKEEEEIIIEVYKDVNAALNKVATEGNYHLILNSRKGRGSAVLYTSPTIDVTSKIQEALKSL